MTYRHNWGEDRVYFYNAEDELKSVPVQWTDVLEPDRFVAASSGRALFRTTELMELVLLLDELDQVKAQGSTNFKAERC